MVITKVPGQSTHCPSPVPDIGMMFVPFISHSILGTAHIVRGVGAGAVYVVDSICGEAVHLSVDVVPPAIIQWPDMVHCMQVPTLMEAAVGYDRIEVLRNQNQNRIFRA